VFSALKSLFSAAPKRERIPAPASVALTRLDSFAFVDRCGRHNGYPILDWDAVSALLEVTPPRRRNEAWTACERAWLLHFRDALGADFHLDEAESAMLVSALPENVARATLEFMGRTLRRIGIVLDGVARAPELGKDILIVFKDQDSYYRYVSYYYPERGEFAFSGGMHINRGCAHYVTMADDMRTIEPTIAHEMTHGCLAHLPLPLWLNEGTAVNMEGRLTGRAPQLYTPEQMHAKHLRFWNDATIQEFWSGWSFHRPDEGNALSYDLARIMVEQLALDWDRFREFAVHADHADAGSSAARRYLGRDLGEVAAALLESDASAVSWAPQPGLWQEKAVEPVES